MIGRAGAALAALLAGCGSLPTTSEGVAFLRVQQPATTSLTVGDTIRLHAVALDKAGQPLDVPVAWRTLDTTLSVDGGTGLVTAVAAGTGRVQAVVGNDELVSDPLAFTIKDTPAALRRP